MGYPQESQTQNIQWVQGYTQDIYLRPLPLPLRFESSQLHFKKKQKQLQATHRSPCRDIAPENRRTPRCKLAEKRFREGNISQQKREKEHHRLKSVFKTVDMLVPGGG